MEGEREREREKEATSGNDVRIYCRTRQNEPRKEGKKKGRKKKNEERELLCHITHETNLNGLFSDDVLFDLSSKPFYR
jgi:hypothetical protein